ncbi:4a-hydroxytetrahydrobiopterin dehydratase [Glutamicibacter sp. PAEs-4]|uniref:4a-hydroxytetrahydrobiopterin dehydratase n=1 Tax=Glutamicibacter sp. PAEs-4 TaxID=3444114 RepID=UPI0009FCC921
MTSTGPLPRIESGQVPADLPDWMRDDLGLRAAYRFDSASTALQFIVQVGLRAEQDNRHPHLDWRITTVELRLASNQPERLSAPELELARHISIEAGKLDAQVITGRQ